MKKEKYWAGFCDNRIACTLEHFGDRESILAIYFRKRTAKKCYQDVRAVEIREIKKS